MLLSSKASSKSGHSSRALILSQEAVAVAVAVAEVAVAEAVAAVVAAVVAVVAADHHQVPFRWHRVFQPENRLRPSVHPTMVSGPRDFPLVRLG